MHKILQRILCLTTAFLLLCSCRLPQRNPFRDVSVDSAPLSSQSSRRLDGMVRVYLILAGQPFEPDADGVRQLFAQ